jgi:hypothetical protein
MMFWPELFELKTLKLIDMLGFRWSIKDTCVQYYDTVINADEVQLELREGE